MDKRTKDSQRGFSVLHFRGGKKCARSDVLSASLKGQSTHTHFSQLKLFFFMVAFKSLTNCLFSWPSITENVVGYRPLKFGTVQHCMLVGCVSGVCVCVVCECFRERDAIFLFPLTSEHARGYARRGCFQTKSAMLSNSLGKVKVGG